MRKLIRRTGKETLTPLSNGSTVIQLCLTPYQKKQVDVFSVIDQDGSAITTINKVYPASPRVIPLPNAQFVIMETSPMKNPPQITRLTRLHPPKYAVKNALRLSLEGHYTFCDVSQLGHLILCWHSPTDAQQPQTWITVVNPDMTIETHKKIEDYRLEHWRFYSVFNKIVYTSKKPPMGNERRWFQSSPSASLRPISTLTRLTFC